MLSTDKLNASSNSTLDISPPLTESIDIVNKLKYRTVLLDSGRIVKDYKKGEYTNESI